MGLGKILLGAAFTGSLLFTGCDEHKITGDLDVKVSEDPVGEIVGIVLWDPEDDGTNTGTKADVGLDKWPYLIAGVSKNKTTSTWQGNFSFHDVPVGSYTIYVQKGGSDLPLYHYWSGKKGVSVVKQQVTNAGDIIIKPHTGPVY